MSFQLLPEHLACILVYVNQSSVISWRAIARAWTEAAALGIVHLCCRVSGDIQQMDALSKCITKLPNLRRLDLQRSLGLRCTLLGYLLEAAQRAGLHMKEVDVTFARPLHFPEYKDICRCFSAITFFDVLAHRPSPNLAPADVVFIQSYALHAGRIDVCYAFASPGNRANTGPLARFSQLFEPPSPYACMVECSQFELKSSGMNLRMSGTDTAVLTVEFEKDGQKRLFQWLVSCQRECINSNGYPSDGNEFAGCWMTDSVSYRGI
eukprot:TRINITY_DN66081_c0_g1_i1.p1 TRINITY_DN66081_c0_g1~~TRINITY_DN66081_c0_g1_i1.p1  ORF type:complete len:265 (+),score=28.04 TRINITY_DN66081_c0_g1_i1:51-845(+)